jgi:hypothetical protein
MKPQQLICDAESPLRPSDWPVRLAGLDSSFGPDRRLRYSHHLRPVTHEGRRCVCLHQDIALERPELLRAVADFARVNQLQQLTLSHGAGGVAE